MCQAHATIPHMGGFQHYGPLLGPLNTRCGIILGDPKRDHNNIDPSSPYITTPSILDYLAAEGRKLEHDRQGSREVGLNHPTFMGSQTTRLKSIPLEFPLSSIQFPLTSPKEASLSGNLTGGSIEGLVEESMIHIYVPAFGASCKLSSQSSDGPSLVGSTPTAPFARPKRPPLPNSHGSYGPGSWASENVAFGDLNVCMYVYRCIWISFL